MKLYTTRNGKSSDDVTVCLYCIETVDATLIIFCTEFRVNSALLEP